ncbi:MAG: hypothetical protein JWP00_1790 [Chloroflexi bacterium]|nr:hypothetical protein [Chloroflexota bacterium]
MPKLSQTSEQAATTRPESESLEAVPTGESVASGPLFSTGTAAGRRPTGTPLNPGNILALQRTLGNQAVQRLIQRERNRTGANKAQNSEQEPLSAATETPALDSPALNVQRFPDETEADFHEPEAAEASSDAAIMRELGDTEENEDEEPDMNLPGQVPENEEGEAEAEAEAEAEEAPPPMGPAQIAAQLREQVAEEEQAEDQIDEAAAGAGMGNLAGDVDRPDAVGREAENLGVHANPAVAQAQLQAEGVRDPAAEVGQAAANPLNQQIQQAAQRQGIGSYLSRGLNWTAEAISTAVNAILGVGGTILNAIASGGSWLMKKIAKGLKAVGSAIGRGAKAVGSAIVSGAKTAGNGVVSGAKYIGNGIVSGAKYIGNGIVSGAKSAGSAIAGGVKAGVATFKKKPVATSFAGAKTGYGIAGQGVTAASNLSKVGASVSNASLQAAANFARVSPWFSAVFGAISSALDLRSLISSLRKSSKLDQLAKEAKSNNAEPEIIEALEYAVAQKKKKASRKGLSLFGGAASTTAGVLGILGLFGVLASNPVGWAILALGAVGGAIGIGIFLYKLIRSKTKENKGKAREKHAKKIWEGLQNQGGVDRATALKAITALGLKESDVTKPKGWELIKDKLASN